MDNVLTNTRDLLSEPFPVVADVSKLQTILGYLTAKLRLASQYLDLFREGFGISRRK
jgi:hypothetical protein